MTRNGKDEEKNSWEPSKCSYHLFFQLERAQLEQNIGQIIFCCVYLVVLTHCSEFRVLVRWRYCVYLLHLPWNYTSLRNLCVAIWEMQRKGGRKSGTAEDTVREESWTQRLLHHDALPSYLRDNEFLHRSHRPQLNSFIECFKSIFRIHTETGNIWTHLLGQYNTPCWHQKENLWR